MLAQLTHAICLFTDFTAVLSPHQAAALFSTFPRGFFAERVALRSELRAWQEKLGGGEGKVTLLSEVFANLQQVSTSPFHEQLLETQTLADQTAALLFAQPNEAEALLQKIFQSFVWPPQGATVLTDKVLAVIGALLPVLLQSPLESSSPLAAHATAVIARFKVFAQQRMHPLIVEANATDLEYSLAALHAHLQAFTALQRLVASIPSLLLETHVLATGLIAASATVLNGPSTGAAAVEWQKLRAMEALHALVKSPHSPPMLPSSLFTSLINASVSRPRDNEALACVHSCFVFLIYTVQCSGSWSTRVASFSQLKWESLVVLSNRPDLRSSIPAFDLLTAARAALDG